MTATSGYIINVIILILMIVIAAIQLNQSLQVLSDFFFPSSRLSSFLLSESLLETYFTVDMNFMVTTVTISYSCNSYCSKVPSWLTTFAPADALIMQEEAWNAFPRCKSGSPHHHDIILCVTCSF